MSPMRLLDSLRTCRLQTAAEYSVPGRTPNNSDWLAPAQHSTGIASRRVNSTDWQSSSYDDGFQHDAGQHEGDFIAKPVFQRLKQLAKEGKLHLIA